MENIIKDIISKLSNSYGDDYLESISQAFLEAIDADYVFIAEINEKSTLSSTISLVSKNGTLDNFEYELLNTPCQNVFDNGVCCYPKNVCDLFPLDQLLVDMSIDGYLGTPLYDTKGKVSGLIVALYENEIKNEDLATTLFKLFTGRIAAEISRKSYEGKLENLNEQLESQVEKRTIELKNALNHLEKAKNKIVESEKFAALGKVVAGIAHEINTPLGVAITTHSIISDELIKITEKVNNNKLTKHDLNLFFEKARETIDIQGGNLFKTRDLVDDFKKTVIETSLLNKEKFNVLKLYSQTVDIMDDFLKSKNINVNIESSLEKNINSCSGLHNQVLTSLINNSAIHAFNNEKDDNEIKVIIKPIENNLIQVDYFDNGSGIKENDENKIFEPFYTTIRAKGGTGLGLSFVYNIISQQLKGDIEIIPSFKGFHLRYTFMDDKNID